MDIADVLDDRIPIRETALEPIYLMNCVSPITIRYLSTTMQGTVFTRLEVPLKSNIHGVCDPSKMAATIPRIHITAPCPHPYYEPFAVGSAARRRHCCLKTVSQVHQGFFFSDNDPVNLHSPTYHDSYRYVEYLFQAVDQDPIAQ